VVTKKARPFNRSFSLKTTAYVLRRHNVEKDPVQVLTDKVAKISNSFLMSGSLSPSQKQNASMALRHWLWKPQLQLTCSCTITAVYIVKLNIFLISLIKKF